MIARLDSKTFEKIKEKVNGSFYNDDDPNSQLNKNHHNHKNKSDQNKSESVNEIELSILEAFNSPLKADFYEVSIKHEYVSDCDQFNFMIFLLIPSIAFTVVVRIAYVYRSSKVIRYRFPGRFFKKREI